MLEYLRFHIEEVLKESHGRIDSLVPKSRMERIRSMKVSSDIISLTRGIREKRLGW